jgi:hypothetical protein
VARKEVDGLGFIYMLAREFADDPEQMIQEMVLREKGGLARMIMEERLGK